MIDEIQIQNFQSLEKVRLRLGRFTLILGESDLGKSSTLRAIYALCHNSPGQDTIRKGTTRSAVRAIIEGSKITWIKGASASYHLDDRVFDKTGRSVPDEVGFVLRMGAVEAGDVNFDPNFHMQWDSPFLVTAKPSERAKILGKLSGVTTLTLATQEARRREQSTKRLLDTRLGDLRILTSDLDKYSDLDERGRQVAEVSRLVASVERTSNRAVQANNLHSTIRERAHETKRLKGERALAEGHLLQLGGLGEPPAEAAERAAVAARAVERMRRLAEPVRLLKIEVSRLRESVAENQAAIDAIPKCEACGRPFDDTVHVH